MTDGTVRPLCTARFGHPRQALAHRAHAPPIFPLEEIYGASRYQFLPSNICWDSCFNGRRAWFSRCFPALTRVGLLMLVAGLLLAPGRAFAQTSASMTGVVQDPSGALLPGASVTATETQTGVVHTTTTNSDGRYTFPNLAPGTYSIKATASGFQTLVHSNIVLQVQQAGQSDFKLQPGGQTQTVVVNSSAQALDTQDTTVGQVIENKRITTLPLNGRDFLQLISLSANVTSGFGAPGQATLRQGGSRATEQYAGDPGGAQVHLLAFNTSREEARRGMIVPRLAFRFFLSKLFFAPAQPPGGNFLGN